MLVLPGDTLVGETVMVPAPLASVNVAEAVSCEVSPVAVAWMVAPISSGEKMYQLVLILPFSSATTSHGSNDRWIGR